MKKTNRTSRLLRTAGVFMLASTLAVAGCDTDELLEVTDPDTVNPGTLEDPELIDIVVAGAIGEFTTGYTGTGGDAFLSVSALMSDELYSSGTFTTRTATDRREQFTAQNGNTSDGGYINLQQARRALKDAAVQVAGLPDLGSGSDEYAWLKALEGYTYVALAEGWCSGIPISNVNAETGEFEYGSGSSTAELLNAAIVRFDEAIASGGTYADLGRVGKARAQVQLGLYGPAATTVGSVADDYVYHVLNSENTSNNSIWGLQANGRYAISDDEGSGGDNPLFRSVADPRIQWVEDPAGGFDEGIPMFISLKYTGRPSPFVLASGVEARLIEAEAELDAGDFQGMVDILNALRADVLTLMPVLQPDYEEGVGENPATTLAALATPGTEPEAIDVLFEERARWLFLDGHRLGDLRRLVRDYGRATADVYPSGDYHKGGSYGSDVVFEVDFDESNNLGGYEVSSCNVGTV